MIWLSKGSWCPRSLSVLVLLITATAADAAWFDPDWQYRKAIEIQASEVVGDHTDFPVMFTLSDPELAASAQADGDDLVFALEDGTRLSHEIERYDSVAGELRAWVRIPSLAAASNTRFYLYYGNPSVSSQADPQNVWGSGFQMVHHLEETGGRGTNLSDSTANGHGGDIRGQNNNHPVYLSDGIVNGARAHPGALAPGAGNAQDPAVRFFDFGDPGLSDGFTAEAWARVDASQSGNDHHPILWKGNVIGWGANYLFRIAVRSGNTLTWGVTCGGTEAYFDGGSARTGQWAHYAISFDGTTTRAYINGQQVASDTGCAGRALNVTSGPYLSGYGIVNNNNETVLNGDVDEVRISSLSRSEGWLRTHYNNLSEPESFFAVGVEEADGFCDSLTAIFCDDFERSSLGADWAVGTAYGGDAGISDQTSQSPSRSLYTSSGVVAVTLAPQDLSSLDSGTLSYWWRRGASQFSESPDRYEDLRVEYLNNTGGWELIERYPGNGSAGESASVSFTLPADALHSNFRVRFYQEWGNSGGYDFWHIDDVVLQGASLTCEPDDFERPALGSDWATSVSRGSFTPQLVPVDGNQRLRMTQAQGNQATAVSFQRLFPGADNLIQVEFDYYAYGGTGADGIAVVFSDASVTPQAGGYGGSLGYAQEPDETGGFAGGWLGIGLDEYGNFSHDSEGRLGGNDELTPDSVAVRGAAENGYPYIADSGRLPNGIDSENDNNPYRYRITIDSRGGKTPVLTVERNGRGTGNRFQEIIQVTLSGQPPIPENLFFSLTGSTGGSTNIHELDNLQICADKVGEVERRVDHFEIIHSGNALTCRPEEITIRACDDADCSVLFPDPVEVTLSPSGWVGGNTFTMNGTATRSLAITSPGTVTLGVPSSDPGTVAFSRTLCDDGSGGLAADQCEITFFDSGFDITVPDHIADTDVTATIAAVRKDDTSQRCVPGFDNETKDVALWSSYVNPSSGTLSVFMDGGALPFAAGGTTALSFDGNGVATVGIRYPDVGRVRLNARYEGSGDDAGLVMVGDGEFVARPDHFQLDIPGNPAATSVQDDNAFVAAGADFEIGVASINASGNVTPNFGRETPAEDVDLESSLVAPSGGDNPALAGDFGAFGEDCAGATAAGGTACGQFRWPEVGIIRVNPTLASGSYLGTGDVTGNAVSHVGRFIPDRFSVTITEPGEVEPFCDLATAFAYTGQTFSWRSGTEPTLRVDALNADGVITRNYTLGNFQRLSPGSLTRTPAAADETALDANGNPFPVTTTLGGTALTIVDRGQLQFRFASSDQIVYDKTAQTRVAPFTPDYRIELTQLQDADSVSAPLLPTDLVPNLDFELRYGRLQLENVYGPETTDLSMPFQVDYYTAAGFVQNTADSCWAYNTGGVTLDQSDLSGGSTSVVAASDTLVAGAAAVGSEVILDAPGEGNQGDVRVTFPVPVWLSGDYNDDGVLEDPTGLATFGVYRGHDRIIYWREVDD